MPPAAIERNPVLGKLVIYKRSFTLPVPLAGTHAGEAIALTVHYQGCAVRGICYPPVTHTVRLVLPHAASAGVITTPRAPAGAHPHTPWLAALLGAFGVGLLLTFTPCVLPMIPILSGILVGQGSERLSKRAGLALSLAYVLGTGVTYALAGAVAGATGAQLQAVFENAWGLGALSLVFVLMALSLFGLYDLQMPGLIQNRVHARAQGMNARSLGGAFVLGLLSALVVGACVTPLVISVLAVAISSHNAWLGAALMFCVALGMGTVLVALGVGAGHLLPKAGPWMDTIKHVFGVLLLGVAIYLIGFLPAVPVLLLWGALLIIVGAYIGYPENRDRGPSGWAKLRAGIGLLVILWGGLCVVGGLAGRRDPLKPLSAALIEPAATPARGAPAFTTVRSEAALKRALAQARRAGRPALVDFSASWCIDCLRLQKTTFANRRVRGALAGFTLIEADVTHDTRKTRAMKRRYGILGPPAVLFFSARGTLDRAADFYGYKGPAAVLRRLREIRP